MPFSVLRYPEGDLAAFNPVLKTGREVLADDNAELMAFQATSPPLTSDGWYGALPVLQVTNYQMRLALIELGAFAAVDGYLRGPGVPIEALQAWDYANIFYYADPLVDMVVAALSLNKRAVFALAATK